MKKFMILIAMSLMLSMGYAQNLYTNGSAKGTFWSSADTISESETSTYVIRVKGESVMDLGFQLLTTKVSGTVTQDVAFQGSNDGTTYIALDTIANSGASTNTQFLTLDDFNYSYCRVTFTNVATAQKAWFKMDYSFREE